MYFRGLGGVFILINMFFFLRSTTANLACFTPFLADSFDSRGQADVVCTEFSKEFDQVDHFIS